MEYGDLPPPQLQTYNQDGRNDDKLFVFKEYEQEVCNIFEELAEKSPLMKLVSYVVAALLCLIILCACCFLCSY